MRHRTNRHVDDRQPTLLSVLLALAGYALLLFGVGGLVWMIGLMVLLV